MRRLVFCFAVIAVTSSSVAAPAYADNHATAKALFSRLVALRARAGAIAETTTTGQRSAAFWSDVGRPFYRDEKVFQSAADSFKPEIETPSGQIAIDLQTVDQFLYDAVVDSLASCNKANARGNLRVVDAFIHHIQRELAGHREDDWSPPGFEDDNSSRCQR